MEKKTIYDLNLHECMEIETMLVTDGVVRVYNRALVIRVNDGWLYRFGGIDKPFIFVPYTTKNFNL